jgi:hypothetical protein
VAGLALGEQHSLFLDRAGAVWAVGANLEGQCGLGTPIEELARQHRRAFSGALQLEALLRGRPAAGAARHEAYLRSYAEANWGGGTGPATSSVGRRAAALAALLRPAAGGAAARGAAAAQFAGAGGGGGFGGGAGYGGGGGGGGGGAALGITPSGIWGVDLERHLHETGLQPGIVHTPTKVERSLFDDVWGLGSSGGSGAGGASASVGMGGGSGDSAPGAGTRGLESERVVGVSASRYFSVAVTDRGDVWTFGASFTGALAQRGVSWSTAARPVEGEVAAAIAAEGGAVAVAAAGTGAACVTAR